MAHSTPSSRALIWTFGTPVRVNTMSGIFASIFMVVAVAAFNGGTNSKFVVVLDIAISTTLISYLWIFPAALKLRYSHGHVHRPYVVPGGKLGMWLCTALITVGVALGSWVWPSFPGRWRSCSGSTTRLSEHVGRRPGHIRSAHAWDASAVILLLAVVGYAQRVGVREKPAVDIPDRRRDQDSEIAAIT